ncbi:hypothetical protein KTO58_22140 [Chitinophaga pendula]|uniref:MutS-related protein n=1 Tax=Chitinophaga TaxID=79328 RepID=UPI000BAF9F17|nr:MULTISPECIES: hypothetical protein [Chitinophaga]ASZ10681.1 hypothetical protein CK934_06645 [Chitinophaga sp. MD30]UCJ06344.1 hypothetical protein KTO58_22140 [Chitinophaga pendula]
MTLEVTYRQLIADFGEQARHSQQQLRVLAWTRLFLFIGLLVFGWQYIARSFETIWLLAAIGAIVAFVFVLIRYQRCQDRLRLQQALLTLNEKELKLVTINQADFEDGNRFVDEEHPFTSDLDVFGPSSLYQHINRTGTLMGAEYLAETLRAPLQDVAAIKATQMAVETLKPMVDFRQQLSAHAVLSNETMEDRRSLQAWLVSPYDFITRKGLRLVSWIMPLLLMGTFLYYLTSSTLYPMLIVFFSNAGILLMNVKRVNAQHQWMSNKEKVLHKFSALLELIRQQSFGAASSLKEQQQLAGQAGKALYELARISNALDQRMNILVGLFLNTVLLYDLHCMFRLEKWKMRYQAEVMQWLDVIARMETWNSLATFAYNHPGYVSPEADEAFSGLEVIQAGHPLIPAATCVTNDLVIEPGTQFLVITGSNMSGKSTFLRSVGSNLLLAMCGAPVCAASFRFAPMHIMTSMRIKDSIAKHTSYFQAELLRLQQIVKTLQQGSRVFILLDEILKGTNSEDKLSGSRKLIEHFLQYNCLGMIATHDLELGHMEHAYPIQVRNYCFESTIDNNQLYFDYRMRPGIARNKNATFLMHQMHII